MKYELTHHGVKGQKWGSRNGPPYPLNAAGKASLAKQKKASGGSTSSGPDDTSKKKIKVTRDAAGHVTKVSRSGGSGTSPLQKLKKASVKKSTTKYSAELMERESRYGLDFEDNRVPKNVKESVEYKRYKEAQERYKKEFNKNPDSEEAVQAYERLEDAGHDLSRLVRNMNESGGYGRFSEIHEIHRPERVERDKDKRDKTPTEPDAITRVKPDSDMTVDDAKNFWDNMFKGQGEYKPSYSNIPADKMTKPSEMSPEQLQSFKAKTIREGDVKTVQANRNLYTDNEIMAAITRNNINKQLTEITAKDVKNGAEKVDNIISGIQRTTKLVNTGVDAWNTVAKISTSLGVDLPVLDGSRPGSNSVVYDRKSKAQLEKMIANPQKYTAKEIEGMKDAYDKLVKAQNAVRAEKNKNLGLTEAYINKGKYTEDELNNAIRRADTLKRLQEATAAKQEEYETYANMKAEIFKAAADDKKWFSENGKPWWDDEKLKL